MKLSKSAVFLITHEAKTLPSAFLKLTCNLSTLAIA